ncbi:MAG: MetQ/NlpA family ABC transporter substrate-binding protein [Tetragenococcus halophilus]|uniref:MetQ/NlpA family ABC transporter substrate-binding protein n=1 Tax=Tetragenococcus halophilus TaxID=51669 RepID=UPI001927EAFE|nr:MetQ/NlpA family ABC transporter substrate-binding protein [Tetragenococcus halophilus]MCF1601649.1 MetQ/NlpA family ABC transporter substrate-binding protein [Tetragenococcus halophilus]MCF1676500.1 MetQ/NlpA family ABC transporter substrate-binding protein [Tetragenococcus halophilus]MDN6152792.1 MetQ/NlpA family ABC transporter substrate-binding protein [Tetragenococcus halophilus]MDN6526943.1 MetQ/NlpA family ABC transporter substrate-binding protein [Tetragenococcus halophilus]MDN65682
MKKRKSLLAFAFSALFIIAGCSSGQDESEAAESTSEDTTVNLGVIGADTDVWDDVKDRLADEGIDIEYVEFTEYSQPNTALENGDIDLNSFQHQDFLDNYNDERGSDLVSIGNTVNAPLGIYSEKIEDVEELEDGAEISIPDDVTNGGRALKLLQTADLIQLDEDAQNPTVSDITANPKDLEITELEASQTARAMEDVDASVINSGMAVDAGLSPNDDAIFLEPVDDTSRPYVNIIAARKEDEDNEVYQKVVDAYQSEETKEVIEETSDGADIPAWEEFGRK